MGCDNPIIKLDKKYDPDVLILQWENLHSKLHYGMFLTMGVRRAVYNTVALG